MATLAVLGLGGSLHTRVVAALRARGHEVLAAALAPSGEPPDGGDAPAGGRDARADGREAAAAVAGARGVVDLTPAGDDRVLDLALQAGRPGLDARLDAAEARARRDRAARAGVAWTAGAGFPAPLWGWLAARAAAAAGEPSELHLSLVLPDRGGARAAAGPGARRDLAGLLGGLGPVWRDGATVEELAGEERRLAWFPRPVGPAHAAGLPLPAALQVAADTPSARTVRTYLALSTPRAEALQLAAGAARWAPAGRWLRARWSAGRGTRLAERIAWAVVVEASGQQGVARAWANGYDPVAVAAEAVAVQAAALGDRAAATPSGLVAPEAALDALADAGRLRWAVIRPSQGQGPALPSEPDADQE